MALSQEFIEYQVEDGRARITLNRPDKRNALSIPMLKELHDALWEADNDKAVHCVILRGAGSSFSGGYDLTPGYNATAAGADEGRTYRNGGIYNNPTIDDDIWRLEQSQRLRMAIFDMQNRPSRRFTATVLPGAPIWRCCAISSSLLTTRPSGFHPRAIWGHCQTRCGSITAARNGRSGCC